MKSLKLPSGMTGFTNEAGQFVATGSAMGRRDTLPDDAAAPCKLRMERLRWVDGDYDQFGAYWGNSGGTSIYCAHGDAGEVSARVFVRASSREEAKTKVRQTLPNAAFYR